MEEGESGAQSIASQIQGPRGATAAGLINDTYVNLGEEDPPRQNSLGKAGLYKNADLFSGNCFGKKVNYEWKALQLFLKNPPPTCSPAAKECPVPL